MDRSAQHNASFRDPSGFIFESEGVLYRQVNRSYAEQYDRLIRSGLGEELQQEGLLIAHQEVDVQLAPQPDVCFRVLRPERVPFISYPYEWCFTQLKRAALTTLDIQLRALARGMVLKDASAFNVQFIDGRPVFIDTLSFEEYHGGPWLAYRQFCQHFLAPLLLACRCHIGLSRLSRLHIDGVPLDLASRLLGWRSWLSPGVLMHVHLHAWAQSRYGGSGLAVPRQSSMNARGVQGIVESLARGIRRLLWQPGGTEWGEYYSSTNYSDVAFQAKREWLAGAVRRVQPSMVWDLGANTGVFSRLASRTGIQTVAFDLDPAAVEKNYLQILDQHEIKLLPLVMDLTNPTSALGWANQERMSLAQRGPCDLLIAIALVHHLAISNNVPLERIAAFFAQLCRTLAIEFVPKQDSQVQKLLASREDIFTDYHEDGFRDAFAHWFNVKSRHPIPDSERVLYLMERKTA